MVKRIFDIIISGILLVILLPFSALLVLIYVVSGSLPILFKQERLGLRESTFILFKFRTLKMDDTMSLANRSFILGKWLRKSGLDELPQLIHVMSGSMSLVGPRPLPVYYKPLFTKEQRLRFQVKPGLTGLTQINGGAKLPWSKKFQFDLQYINNQSFIGDLKILIQTVWVVFTRKEDGLNEEPFVGTYEK